MSTAIVYKAIRCKNGLLALRANIGKPMHIVCLDLAGVLIPQIWSEFSRCSGIPDISITTRDEPVYDKLMRFLIETLLQHDLTPLHTSRN